MKKVILLVAVMAICLSCSKDDSNEIEPTMQNLLFTKWQFSKITKEDGTVVNYEGRCSTKKDFFEMTYDGSGEEIFNEFYYGTNCDYSNCYNCYANYSAQVNDERDFITFNSFNFYYQGHISYYSKSKLKVTYETPRDIINFSSYGKIKAIELVKFVEE